MDDCASTKKREREKQHNALLILLLLKDGASPSRQLSKHLFVCFGRCCIYSLSASFLSTYHPLAALIGLLSLYRLTTKKKLSIVCFSDAACCFFFLCVCVVVVKPCNRIRARRLKVRDRSIENCCALVLPSHSISFNCCCLLLLRF